jgi:hypothetical protein
VKAPGACRSTAARLKGIKASYDLIDADSGDVVVESGRKITAAHHQASWPKRALRL